MRLNLFLNAISYCNFVVLYCMAGVHDGLKNTVRCVLTWMTHNFHDLDFAYLANDIRRSLECVTVWHEMNAHCEVFTVQYHELLFDTLPSFF